MLPRDERQRVHETLKPKGQSMNASPLVGVPKMKRILIGEFFEFLIALRHRNLAPRHLAVFPIEHLYDLTRSMCVKTGPTELVADADKLYLLGMGDQYLMSLRNSKLADEFLMHYRLVRPLDMSNIGVDPDTGIGMQYISNKISDAIRLANSIDRQETRSFAKRAREKERMQKDGVLEHHPPRISFQPRLRHLVPNNTHFLPEGYAKLDISTQVTIAGKMYTATIDTTQNSMIDARLVPGWGIDFGLPGNPPKPKTFNDLLFQRPFDTPCAKVRIGLMLEQGSMEISPMLSYKRAFEYKIILGKDVFVHEQAEPGVYEYTG
ncbi:hypothetical protein P171DRAFT_440442 [Karstenula rhodostoma CBS 690.94]|uniref:Uncharacterized protein n=1 Tax=Karstenula rhodostoma CBS 690.94 TaxID=1392251 RepID=A0A9P4PRL2_9PLEO|nr:hypothetical protein P171DRAFT_440442 [Karstenula rhodostoma CBS 690.94]